MTRQILVVDIGGNNVKLRASGQEEPVRVPSGPAFTPEEFIAGVMPALEGWSYDAVSVGYPGVVRNGRPAVEPRNLGPGWVDLEFESIFQRPTKVINDAALQALGGYEGGHMLFLGFGTGLGSAMVADGVLLPMELGHLPYRNRRTFEDDLGREARKRLGKKRWRGRAVDAVTRLATALEAEAILLGGGEAKHLAAVLDEFPSGTRIGSNDDAFRGGLRLWESRTARRRRG